jgi:hypothetical protein
MAWVPAGCVPLPSVLEGLVNVCPPKKACLFVCFSVTLLYERQRRKTYYVDSFIALKKRFTPITSN